MSTTIVRNGGSCQGGRIDLNQDEAPLRDWPPLTPARLRCRRDAGWPRAFASNVPCCRQLTVGLPRRDSTSNQRGVTPSGVTFDLGVERHRTSRGHGSTWLDEVTRVVLRAGTQQKDAGWTT